MEQCWVPWFRCAALKRSECSEAERSNHVDATKAQNPGLDSKSPAASSWLFRFAAKTTAPFQGR